MTLREVLPIRRSTDSLVKRGTDQLLALQEEVNRIFNDYVGDVSLPAWWHNVRSTLEVSPAVDVTENDKDFRISAEIPGMKAKDVEVSVSDGYITLKGEKKQETKEEKEGYFRQERSYGAFERRIALPETANLDKAEANASNGLLTITVPKKAGAQSKGRKLEVKQAA